MNFNPIENKPKLTSTHLLQYIYIYTYLMDLKVQIRNFIVQNSKLLMNTKVIIGCFPILFGVSKTFYSKYQDQSFINLFQYSLPGISSEQSRILWPTFEQIFANKLESELRQPSNFNKSTFYIKRLDFYTDSVLIKTNSNWNAKQKHLYGGYFSNFRSGNYAPNQLGNNWYIISSYSTTSSPLKFNLINQYKKNWIDDLNSYKKNNILYKQDSLLTCNTINNNNYYYLDELPTKLHHSYKTSTEQNFSTIKPHFRKFNTTYRSSNISLYSFPARIEKNLEESVKQNSFLSKKINHMSKFFSVKKDIENTTSSIILKGIQNSTSKNAKYIIQPPFFKFSSEVTKTRSSKALSRVSNNTHKQLKKSLFVQNKVKKNFYEKNIIAFSHSDYARSINNAFKNKNSILATSTNFQSILQFLNDETSTSINLSQKKIFNSLATSELLHLIEKIFDIHENGIIIPRTMSGYIIPDVNTNQSMSIIAQFFYKKTNVLIHTIFPYSFSNIFHNSNPRIEHSKAWNPVFYTKMSQNFSHSSKFLNAKFNPANFEIFSKPVEYFSADLEQILYQGPSVLQNRDTNELNITNLDQVKQWVNQFLGADNPLSDRRETFFGKNVFARYSSTIDKQYNFEKNIKNKNLASQIALFKVEDVKVALLNKGRSISLFEMSLNSINVKKTKTNDNRNKLPYKEILKPSPIISCDSYPYIAYLNQSEWHVFIKKLFGKKDELIPIMYVESPKQNAISWPLIQFDYTSLNNSIPFSKFSLCLAKQGEKQNLKNINSTFTTNSTSNSTSNSSNNLINYNYFPYSQSLVKDVLPRKHFFGKTYKKNVTIYKNTPLSLNKFAFANKKAELFYPLPCKAREQSNGQSSEIKKKLLQTNFLKSNLLTGSHSRFTKVFYQSLEPVSWDSWLFVTQFSIGLFLVYILQNISQKYGKELKYIISSLYKNENSTEFSLDANTEHENIRIIKSIEKKFRDIAGIDSILPELSEIVWFLRNSGRSFTVGNTIPRRILLTGPPGTGKTLLVQTIAGESEVPVLIESGSSLNQAGTSENGTEKLQNIFNKARELAPCIIFIDEIDTFGEARDQMVHNPVGDNEILHTIYPHRINKHQNTFQKENSDFIPQPKFLHTNESASLNEFTESFDNQTNNGMQPSNEIFDRVNKNVTQNQMNKYRATQEKSNLLMQFLIELDGIATEKKIIVFGATNRPQILDTALTRPGRFNKTFHVDLPTKQKRIEILKLYSKNLGVEKNISWNYLANLTPGLSAADLASVMNQSSMKAIETETIHTIQTIEYGIESITGYTTQKNQVKSFIQSSTKTNLNMSIISLKPSTLIFVNRLAYYQAGKALVHTLLKHHPPVISIHLWPQLKNRRYHLVNAIIEKEFSQLHRRVELESRIIGFYGGKAAELIALFNGFKNTNNKPFEQKADKIQSEKFSYFWQSDLGIEDISFAGWLAQLMITKWYIYSKYTLLQKYNQLQDNSNFDQIKDSGMFELFQELSHETETHYQLNLVKENSQNWITRPWLQREIVKKLEFSYFRKNAWYKIYSGDHEQNENTRYVFPDDYYHNNIYLRNLLDSSGLPVTNQNLSLANQSSVNPSKSFLNKVFPISSLMWNDILNWNRDFIYHNLILVCFNKAVSLVDDNRELLDFFASYLMQKEIIREHEIINIIYIFHKKYKNKV